MLLEEDNINGWYLIGVSHLVLGGGQHQLLVPHWSIAPLPLEEDNINCWYLSGLHLALEEDNTNCWYLVDCLGRGQYNLSQEGVTEAGLQGQLSF